MQGIQVSPAELEGILLGHPDIGDAAVVGVDSPSGATELPMAFVVPKADSSHLKGSDVVEYVDSQVPGWESVQGWPSRSSEGVRPQFSQAVRCTLLGCEKEVIIFPLKI